MTDRRKTKFYKIYDGLPVITEGPNRGQTDYEAAAEQMKISIEDVKKIVGIVKGMYARQPDSTTSVLSFYVKMLEQNLTVDDLGCEKGKYQAARIDDEGPYHNNWRFVVVSDNLIERNTRPQNEDKCKPVVTPVGEFKSLSEASKELNIIKETIKNRIDSGDERFAGWYYKDEVTNKIANRMKKDGKRFFACDNVTEYFNQYPEEEILLEVTSKFESVLKSLLIDTENDPNSRGTAKRLAKMYTREIMSGRYEETPEITAFPNDGVGKYHGMLVVRAEIKSMCSHHHQPVRGTCFIGIIPTEKVIGLSKYIRIAQWYARRGQLQEELTVQIANHIMEATKSQNVAVYIAATHGCVSCRGVNQDNSLTQTTVVYGEFEKLEVKNEFFQQIQLQNTTQILA